jgi:hypothetical protein
MARKSVLRSVVRVDMSPVKTEIRANRTRETKRGRGNMEELSEE